MDINNRLLLDSYYRAVKLKLDNDFIGLLKNEIDRRDLFMNDQEKLIGCKQAGK